MTATKILSFILVLSASGICGAFTPKDHYLLYCGPSSNSAAGDIFGGRNWSNDENSTFSSLSSFSSTITALANHDPSAPPGNPFTAARIFNSSFTYSFPVSPGPKFLRLFFYPTYYSDQYDASQFFISVQANGHLLLRNFSAQLAVNYFPFTVRPNTATQEPYVIKEYYIAVPNGESSLNLTFSPSPPRSYAFVNGIEVVSVPESLYVRTNSITESPSNQISIPNSSALETLYRLNVGGTEVNMKNDGEISGMYRLWKIDDPYIFSVLGMTALTEIPINYTELIPNYTAPELVYQTERHFGFTPVTSMKYNLTWRFKVDPGFYYMVRLHWCELDSHVNNSRDRIFEVYINNQTVEDFADVLAWTHNQRDVPVYRDYILFVTGGNESGGSVDLWIALHPSTQMMRITSYNEVLLNGVEIFKVNNLDDGSLYAPNPNLPLVKTHTQQGQVIEQQKQSHLLVAIIVGIVVLVMLLTCLFIVWRFKAKKDSSADGTSTSKSTWLLPSFQSGSKTTASERGSTLPSHLCRQFSIAQIRLATNDFSEALIVGHGGFGNVYKGTVDGGNGPLAVAIKRLNASSKQGVREFMTEIELLTKLRHVHLVSLIGFCDESREMILVYEYMDRGTLRDHLYNTANKPPLSWNQRLSACLGAAKGLHYLHCGASQMIIHRDVKSTNILLDDKWVSKVSDFGLSKLGPMGADLSHVSTAVKGSIGYLDLEYYKTQRLTEKSDVYSFGVVLFEVLCGRPAVDVSIPKEQVNLAKWARSHQRKGTLDLIVDPNIKDQIAPACLRKFGEVAEKCVLDHGSDRPSMADVVWSLEFVIDLQEKADDFPKGSTDVIPNVAITVDIAATATSSTNNEGDFSSTILEGMIRTNSSSALVLSSSDDFGENVSSTVFTEMFKPKGR